MRRDWTDEQLLPYTKAVAPLESLSFSAAVTDEGWRQLAIALAEESTDAGHAERIVDAFVRMPRYDERQMLRTDIPSSIELRMFARHVPSLEIPSGGLPSGCPSCEPYGGLWRVVTRKGVEATDRCLCDRGVALRARDAVRKASDESAEAQRRSGGEWSKISVSMFADSDLEACE